ncbi:chorismate synthase [Feifania hominis]|uniref:Chorismate synthase n=1 Tax=Feifania hominis TaxID=2763660 RepID=A0A926HUC8_9FIRM|nr:chorismate synthase [Feifania hominis]MBC8535416.1 chorismate synthase [Feifania hominis]
MSSIYGNQLRISIFGESHGEAIGTVVDGFPAGVAVDFDFIRAQMARRRPSGGAFSTKRHETDDFRILSGIRDGRTTGAPICAVMENGDTHSQDYDNLTDMPRPSHADYPAMVRYKGANDPRGGGHFSARLTAPLVFAGSLCRSFLRTRGIELIAHIASIADVADEVFDLCRIGGGEAERIAQNELPVLSAEAGERMLALIRAARSAGDTLGGVVECAVTGMKPGCGSPMFGSVESALSSLLFSIPAVKGVEFGSGFGIAALRGSEANDPYYSENDQIKTRFNHNGGILGGITTGMPIVFRAAFKPISSIAQPQRTLNLKSGNEETLVVRGRHDICVVPRAVPVVENAAAIAVCDLLLEEYGYEGLANV